MQALDPDEDGLDLRRCPLVQLLAQADYPASDVGQLVRRQGQHAQSSVENLLAVLLQEGERGGAMWTRSGG